jgi:hypothetical protein
MLETSITIVGGSNIGKTELTRKFAGQGYRVVCCDDEIEKFLGPYLVGHGYSGGIKDVAKWSGQPFDERYPLNSAIYGNFEEQVMSIIIDRLFDGERLVIDTTGSVVYVGSFLLQMLTYLTKVILLDTCPEHIESDQQRYFAEPKPVIWGDGVYAPRPGEDPMDALRRCYPALVSTRRERYLRMAHIIVPYAQHRDPKFGVNELISLL